MDPTENAIGEAVASIDANGVTLRSGLSREATWGAWSDWIGMLASIGCAIHCAAMPFVIAYLPALGLTFLADEAFHKWMAVGCFVVAMTAFVPGLRKHGRLTPVIIGCVGLVMISIAAFGFAGECCAACESDVTLESAVATSESAVAGAVCTDECCEHCAEEDASGSSIDSDASSPSLVTASVGSFSWLGRVAPWLTPLGGIVLVCAHLLNRHHGCLCGCCSEPNS